nr:HlyD family secretion protein [uncultured Cohaesibacter sp.]
MSNDTEIEANDASEKTAGKKSNKLNLVILALAVVVAGVGYYVWSDYTDSHPSTNDAYVGTPIIHIAPEVTGTVVSVDVKSFSKVKKGDTLFTIDPRSFKASLDMAKANLVRARQKVSVLQSQVVSAQSMLDAKQAALENTRGATQRTLKLAAQGTATQAEADAQKAALSEAEAAVKTAKAALSSAQSSLGKPGDDNPLVQSALADVERAQLDLDNTVLKASADGYVGKIDIRPGSLAAAGMEVAQLVETDQWWVDANFKENALTNIKPGQPAEVTIDMLPGRTFTGKVLALSPASGTAFSLFPPDNATGNWVKVTQRFPVRVLLDNAGPSDGLRVGASSEVTIDTTGGQ